MFATGLVFCFLFYCLVHCSPADQNDNQFRKGRHHPSISLIPPSSNLLSYVHEYNDIDCPYPYQNVGNICLYAKKNCDSTVALSFLSAQYFCQTLGNANGDLAVFRDANEFQDITDYLKFIDPFYSCNYYLGVSRSDVNSGWNWVNDDVATLSKRDIAWAPYNPHYGVPFPSYAILAGSTFFRLKNVADNGTNTSPICRAFPKRDHEVSYHD